MTSPPVLRALLALLVLGLSAFFAFTKPAQLGLDLRGGASITLETQDTNGVQANAESTSRTLGVLRNRVDALGVAESTLAQSGERRILVELPGVTDPAEAEKRIGQTAQLSFHPVLGPGDPRAIPGFVAPTGVPSPGASPESVGPTTAPTASTAPAPSATANGRSLPGAFVTTQATPAPNTPAANTPAASTPAASPVPSLLPAPGATTAPAGGSTFNPTLAQQSVADENGQPLLLGPAAFTGAGVGNAGVSTDSTTGVVSVTIDFKGNGGRDWEALTGAAACNPPGDDRRRVAIVLDGRIISSPPPTETVQCNVGIQGGTTQITGSFTAASAGELAALIKGGALPLRVEVISSSTVGPTLGKEAINASVEAGIIGLSLTALFLIIVYRFVGLLAAVALGSYGLISYGALVALGATLTLPGLGGLLLSAGLAIDANVLVFERAREEFAASRSKRLLPAMDNGFSKAFSAIADSNVTTLLAAGLLFLLASGPVRGFGITLVIGVIASVVSALLITRVFTDFGLRRGLLTKRPGLTGLASLGRFRNWLERRQPDLMQYSRKYLVITGAVLVLAIAGMFVRGFNFGVEFTGGRVVQYTTTQPVSVAEARVQVERAGFPTAVVQESDGVDTLPSITVRTAVISNAEVERVRSSLAEVGGTVSIADNQFIGPTLGDELRTKALIALVVALLAQLAYLAIRFRWTFAAGTVLAMFHDVLIVVGIFAWLGKPIDGVFLAAALTIIGVSVNDSVVTMDRIRETWANNRTKPLRQIVNTAIINTAPRTINTGIGAFFILGALTVLGGASLQDFALALLIGLFVGTYSSAFVASPLMLEFEKRNSAPPPMPKRKTVSASSRPVKKRKPQPVRARVQPQGGTV
ncbi:MAG: protein translocase subunit SecD [Frankiales bacterium]|nr:protein translocase subunit SecD [Frankiales bacterium]